jgi:hypothetical protein
MVRKWPGTYFGVSSGDYEKYWRRKNITMERRPAVDGKNDPAGQHRMEARSGPAKSRRATKPARRPCGFTAKRPAVFRAQLESGRRPAADGRRRGRRAQCLRAGLRTGHEYFPEQLPLANRSRLTASITPSSACWKAKAARRRRPGQFCRRAADHRALNRYGRWWRSLTSSCRRPRPRQLRRHRRGSARHHARHPQSAAGQGRRF